MLRNSWSIIFIVSGILIVAGVIAAAGRLSPRISRPMRQSVNAFAGTIEGVVIDSEGYPVPGARVSFVKADVEKTLVPLEQSDEQGRFRISNLGVGVYMVHGSKEEDGYPDNGLEFYSANSEGAPQVNIGENQLVTDITVRLVPRAAKFVGRVVDSSTNKPVKNVRITLRRVDNPDSYITTGSDLDGDFNILIPPVPVTVEVAAPNYGKRILTPINLRPKETKQLRIPLQLAR